jgi:uncharacterized membrane protein YoaK (UPF0700 family)
MFGDTGDALSHPARIGLGIALGAGVGTALGVTTDNLALWLPSFLGMGIAFGVALATQE